MVMMMMDVLIRDTSKYKDRAFGSVEPNTFPEWLQLIAVVGILCKGVEARPRSDLGDPYSGNKRMLKLLATLREGCLV
jgi:hypothetical protein